MTSGTTKFLFTLRILKSELTLTVSSLNHCKINLNLSLLEHVKVYCYLYVELERMLSGWTVATYLPWQVVYVYPLHSWRWSFPGLWSVTFCYGVFGAYCTKVSVCWLNHSLICYEKWYVAPKISKQTFITWHNPPPISLTQEKDHNLKNNILFLWA
jgi:hypothetical protein